MNRLSLTGPEANDMLAALHLRVAPERERVQGTEVAIVGKRDEVFGPVVLFGLGGTWSKQTSDVTMRLCPISDFSARQLIAENRALPLLDGSGGTPPVDLESIVHAISAVGSVLESFPEISEFKIDPFVVMARGEGAVCADAAVSLVGDTVPSKGSERESVTDGLAGESFQALFNARSIAVVGGSMDASRIGGRLVSHILKGGYEGELLLINPKADPSGPLKSFPSIADVPNQTVDAALIVVPAEAVMKVVEDCGKKGVKVAVVCASGFRETGTMGAERESRLREAAQGAGVRLLGPNMMGVMRPDRKLYAEFTNNVEKVGTSNIGIVTQSGALGASLIDRCHEMDLGLSAWISTGNETDLDVADAMDYFVKDDQTRTIVCWLESVKNGDKLRRAASEAMLAHKPMVLCKSGTSELGKRVALFHTGAFAVDAMTFNSFCTQYGIIRAEELIATLDYAKAFSMQPLPKGNRLSVVSMSGGANTISSDLLTSRGIVFPELSDAAQKKLTGYFPYTYVKNPVDVSANIMAAPQILGEAIDTVLQEEEIDAIMLVIQLAVTEPHGTIVCEGVCRALKYGKPIIVASPFPHSIVPKYVDYLQDHSIPVYRSIESAARSVAAMVRYSQYTRDFLSQEEARGAQTSK